MIKAVIFDWAYTLYDWREREPYPDTTKVLKSLSKKYKLAIVALASDGDIAGRKKAINDNGLEKYFAVILIDVQNKDRLYAIALKELGCQPEEVAIVDDRPIRGIQWGNKNGAMTIWVDRREITHEVPDADTGKPTHTIKNIGELLSFL